MTKVAVQQHVCQPLEKDRQGPIEPVGIPSAKIKPISENPNIFFEKIQHDFRDFDVGILKPFL